MSKCDCWHEVEPFCYNDKINGVCYGTKEREYCQCNGDTSKCDFYPEKRKENKTMKTANMIVEADKNGKTYKRIGTKYLYNRDKKFFIDTDRDTRIDYYKGDFNAIFNWDWEQVSTMTRAEAEEKYGIKIIG